MTSDMSKLGSPMDTSLVAARPESGWALLKFFLLSYAVMWACFFSVAVMSERTPGRGLLLFLGPFAPSLAALWLTARAEGSQGVRALLYRVLQWRTGVRWYLFAIGYMAAIKLTVALLHRAITGSWPRFGHELPGVIIAAIIISAPFQAGEEIGWRGYALPRLMARFGLARASILLGLIWACWHLPQFFIREADTFGPVVLCLRFTGDRAFRCYSVALGAYRRERITPHADALRSQQFQGYCAVCNAGRKQYTWVQRFSCGVAYRGTNVDLCRLFPDSHVKDGLPARRRGHDRPAHRFHGCIVAKPKTRPTGI